MNTSRFSAYVFVGNDLVGTNARAIDVYVKLSLAENKTVYRSGEPIKLVMEFTADREGYMIEVLPDREGPASDTIAVHD